MQTLDVEPLATPAYEAVTAPAHEPYESSGDRDEAVEPYEPAFSEVGLPEPERLAVGGSGGEIAAVIESIEVATAGLDRVRTEIDRLGDSLGAANDRLAEQEARLAAAAERHHEDVSTIHSLEAELAQRTDLFAKLTTQLSAMTETVKESAVEDGDPLPYSLR